MTVPLLQGEGNSYPTTLKEGKEQAQRLASLSVQTVGRQRGRRGRRGGERHWRAGEGSLARKETTRVQNEGGSNPAHKKRPPLGKGGGNFQIGLTPPGQVK